MVYIPGDENPHIGIYRKTIYVACCPISEINRSTFNDIHRYNDVLVQISVEMDNGKWIVRGGKNMRKAWYALKRWNVLKRWKLMIV